MSNNTRNIDEIEVKWRKWTQMYIQSPAYGNFFKGISTPKLKKKPKINLIDVAGRYRECFVWPKRKRKVNPGY